MNGNSFLKPMNQWKFSSSGTAEKRCLRTSSYDRKLLCSPFFHQQKDKRVLSKYLFLLKNTGTTLVHEVRVEGCIEENWKPNLENSNVYNLLILVNSCKMKSFIEPLSKIWIRFGKAYQTPIEYSRGIFYRAKRLIWHFNYTRVIKNTTVIKINSYNLISKYYHY